MQQWYAMQHWRMLSKIDLYGNKCASKHLIGYDDYKIGIIPLCIIIPQMNAYAKYLKSSKCMNLLVKKC